MTRDNGTLHPGPHGELLTPSRGLYSRVTTEPDEAGDEDCECWDLGRLECGPPEDGWRCWSTDFLHAHHMEIVLGQDGEEKWQPTVIFGLARERAPSIGNSSFFHRRWAGAASLQGVEVHTCGKIIIWKGSDPRDLDASKWTHYKLYEPGKAFQVLLKDGCTLVLYDHSYLTYFGEGGWGEGASLLSFHVYIQDACDSTKAVGSVRRFGSAQCFQDLRMKSPLPCHNMLQKVKSSAAAVFRCLTPEGLASVLTSHTADVWDAAISPDGSILITASRDATCRFWEIQTGCCCKVLDYQAEKELGSPLPGAASYNSVACSYSGDTCTGFLVFTGRGCGVIDVLYVDMSVTFGIQVARRGLLVHDETRQGYINALALNPRSLVYSGGTQSLGIKCFHMTFVIDCSGRSAIARQEVKWQLPDIKVRELALDPSSRFLAAAAGDRFLLLHSGNGEVIMNMDSPESPRMVTSVAFSPKDVWLGTDNGKIHVIQNFEDPAEMPSRATGLAHGRRSTHAFGGLPVFGPTSINAMEIVGIPDGYGGVAICLIMCSSTGHVKILEIGYNELTEHQQEQGHSRALNQTAREFVPLPIGSEKKQKTIFHHSGGAVHNVAIFHHGWLDKLISYEHRQATCGATPAAMVCMYTVDSQGRGARWNLEAMLLTADETPVQEYRSCSMGEVFACIVPWTYGMLFYAWYLLSRQDASSFRPNATGPNVGYWVTFCVVFALSLILVGLLSCDVYGGISRECDQLAVDHDFPQNPQKHLRKISLMLWMTAVSSWLWLSSQLLSPQILVNLARITDCSPWAIMAPQYPGLAAWHEGLPPYRKVLEIDPTVVCYEGFHFTLWLTTMLLLIVFCFHLFPLMIVVGEVSRLHRSSGTSCQGVSRLDPRSWWQTSLRVFPIYTGPFAKTQEHYMFETVWSFYRITVPVVNVLTSNYRDLRCVVEAVLGFTLLSVLFWRSPVQGWRFSTFLRVLASLLVWVPLRTYFGMHPIDNPLLEVDWIAYARNQTLG